jgi:hypothetical protein
LLEPQATAGFAAKDRNRLVQPAMRKPILKYDSGMIDTAIGGALAYEDKDFRWDRGGH